MRWRGPAAIVSDRHILSSESMVRKDYEGKGSVKRICGRDPQKAWHQDELIGGKPPAIK
jgi:hypothetical protein